MSYVCNDNPICDVMIGNVEGIHANIRGELEVQSDPIIHETPSEIADNETMIDKTANIVPEAKITCAVETRNQKVQRDKDRRPLCIPEADSINVSADSFRIAQGSSIRRFEVELFLHEGGSVKSTLSKSRRTGRVVSVSDPFGVSLADSASRS